ncbi:killer cell lectin-like receptor subfamily F member 1 [Carettochelys insculpta]|uniref:killer cell lectin-like receptor subfamily F member 1 n=1 Tax=Carettochelys insculpta TaxID=44489 RepID=UPI003EBA4247
MNKLEKYILNGATIRQGPHQGETGATSNVTKTKDVTQRTGNGQAHSAALENSFSHLKQSLCDPAPKSSAEAFRCKLCPVDWLSHGRKCYWVSKEIKDWKGSQEDCTAKRSQMLMIQDWNEMEFIGSATQGPCWIGLHFSSPERKWTWLNNSSFDAKLFPVAGPAKENSCGMIKGSQIRSEICSADFKWICQKDGVFL